MTEEQIIEIIKLEAHKNLTIVDEGTDSYNDYVIRGVDLMAKSLVKLFAIPAVVGQSEQLGCQFCGTEDGKHGWTDDGEVCPLDRTA